MRSTLRAATRRFEGAVVSADAVRFDAVDHRSPVVRAAHDRRGYRSRRYANSWYAVDRPACPAPMTEQGRLQRRRGCRDRHRSRPSHRPVDGGRLLPRGHIRRLPARVEARLIAHPIERTHQEGSRAHRTFPAARRHGRRMYRREQMLTVANAREAPGRDGGRGGPFDGGRKLARLLCQQR